MSLDVSLISETSIEKVGTGVFVRQNGKNVELSYDECKARWPDAEVSVNRSETNEVFTANITHNLNRMAEAAGIYEYLWRPDEINITQANALILPLTTGLVKLLAEPNKFKAFNPENGWGTYDNLVDFVKQYIVACVQFPTAKIEVSR